MPTPEVPESANIRRQDWLDRLLAEADHALRTALATPEPAGTPSPGDPIPDSPLSEMERKQVESLMRINHTGEIAAQALYRGQALVARTEAQRQALLQAADEEQDHLAWCAGRISEFDGHVSYLAPAWYAGSFFIGLSAGLAGDRWSLGFVEETEMQVSTHLDDHLERLPETDHRSRAILARMRADETRHADAARAAGAEPLPAPVKKLMTGMANFMRLVSGRI